MNDTDEIKSKSQIKRDMLALQELGEKLITLSKEHIQKLELPESLLTALEAAKTIKSNGAKRRHMQYIGRLMRGVDPAPIQELFAQLTHQQQQTAAQFHLTEVWRDRLLSEGKIALTAYLHDFPQADSQHLRHLIAQAQKDQQAGKKGAARALFRYLRETQTIEE